MQTSLAIDHVIYVVADLDGAAARLLDDHGLASVAGGRHPGHGTGNRIVPLGPAYLELMGVLDAAEAASSPMGRWAMAARSDDLDPAAVCLRTDDVTSVAHVLGVEPLAMSRRTPSGSELSWRLAGLDGMIEHGWPFFIEWDGPEHPGRAGAPHRVEPTGIAAVAVGAVPPELEELIGSVPALRIDGSAAVSGVAVATTSGPVVLGRAH